LEVWIRESRCTDEVISLVLGLLINFLLETAPKGVQLFLDFYSSTMVQHDGGNKYILSRNWNNYWCKLSVLLLNYEWVFHLLSKQNMYFLWSLKSVDLKQHDNLIWTVRKRRPEAL
jgi:hypothetical protein